MRTNTAQEFDLTFSGKSTTLTPEGTERAVSYRPTGASIGPPARNTGWRSGHLLSERTGRRRAGERGGGRQSLVLFAGKPARGKDRGRERAMSTSPPPRSSYCLPWSDAPNPKAGPSPHGSDLPAPAPPSQHGRLHVLLPTWAHRCVSFYFNSVGK